MSQVFSECVPATSTFTHRTQRSTTVDNLHPFDFMIGFAAHVVVLLLLASEEFRTVHIVLSPFNLWSSLWCFHAVCCASYSCQLPLPLRIIIGCRCRVPGVTDNLPLPCSCPEKYEMCQLWLQWSCPRATCVWNHLTPWFKPSTTFHPHVCSRFACVHFWCQPDMSRAVIQLNLARPNAGDEPNATRSSAFFGDLEKSDVSLNRALRLLAWMTI